MSVSAAEIVASSRLSAPIKPYRGLAAYSEQDEQFFFGREEERKVIVANLLASRITVLYGASGVGKSSVLAAGVIPHLRRLDEENRQQTGSPSLTAVMFPHKRQPEEPDSTASSSWIVDPGLELAEAIRRSCETAVPEADFRRRHPGEPLADYVEWCVGHIGELFVVLDQFEEFFVYHGAAPAGNAFLTELAEAVNRPGLRANFLLGIREDALSKIDRVKPFIPGVFERNLRIDLLTREAARDAITKPIHRYNELVGETEQVEPPDNELVQEILKGVRSDRVGFGLEDHVLPQDQDGEGEAGQRIETSYLQIVMHRLWEEAQQRGTRSGIRAFRLETFRRLGGAQRIVDAHLGSAMQELKPRELDAAAVAFQYLVTPSGAKVAYPLLDLAERDVPDEEARDEASQDGARDAVRRPTPLGLPGRLSRWLLSLAPLSMARRWQSARGGVRAAPLKSAIEKLSGESRILRHDPGPVGKESERRYEIFHDKLAPAILAWRLRYQADARRRKLLRAAVAVGTALLVVAASILGLYIDASRERDRANRTSAQLTLLLRQTKSALALQILTAHSGAVTDARFSPDGTRILTASEDGSAWIWDTLGNLLLQLRGNNERLTSAAFSPDGRLVVTSSLDRTARVWDSITGRQLLDLAGHQRAVTGASFSPNGELILTWSEDGSARVWSATSGVQLTALSDQAPIHAAEFDRKGTMILTVGERGAEVWSLGTRELLAVLGQSGNASVSAEFSPDGNTILTAGTDGVARLWDWRNARELHVLGPIAGVMGGAHFSPNGRFAVIFADDTAQVWSVGSGRLLHILRDHVGEINSAEFSPDGAEIVTASDDDTAIEWKVSSGRLVAVLRGHTERVLVARFSPTGEFVVTASADGTARTWG